MEVPDRNHLFDIGTVSTVRQISACPVRPSGSCGVEGYRARLHDLVQTEALPGGPGGAGRAWSGLRGKSNSSGPRRPSARPMNFDRYCELSPKSASAEMLMNIMSSEDPWLYRRLSTPRKLHAERDKQSILDELRGAAADQNQPPAPPGSVEILEMGANIQRRVQENMTQNQNDALREQVGDPGGTGEDGDNEITAYRRQIMRPSCRKR